MHHFIALSFVFVAIVTGSAAASTTPVYPKIKFTYTADDVRDTCKTVLSRAEQRVEKIVKANNDRRTFKNTMVAFEDATARLSDQLGVFYLLKETSTLPDVQQAASECSDLASAFYVKTFARVDLYQAITKVAQKDLRLDLEDAKLLEETLRSFRRSGAALSEDKRVEVATLNEQLSKLQNEYSMNLAKANDYVELTREELDGMSDDFIGGLEKSESGAYKLVLLDASSYMPFAENGKNADARKKVVTAREKVGAAVNVALLEQAVALRHKMAQTMGYRSFADYGLEPKMAKNPERVLEFLNDLAVRLKPKAESDLAVLLELKRRDDSAATAIEMWDWRYYANQQKKERYAVDGELIREYFPVDHVIQTVFDIYQKMLGVTYTEIIPAFAWAPEVRLFEIRDTRSKALVGHFYLDLYPRANKYKHFAAFDIKYARRLADGSYQTPVSSVVGNFPKPSGEKPALLTHDDVETFFHEFGHIMHQTLTHTRYSSLSGTNVRRDYVEAPSQMLENWAWDRGILSRLSKHYKTGEAMPNELVDKMIAAKHANEGIFWSRQLFFGVFDMTIHTSGEQVDTTAAWRKLQGEIMLMAPTEDAQGQANFGHLMGGYEAGYYGYLWSKVFAEDMFTVFEQEGLESPIAGARYRTWILEPGGTLEPDALIRNFLGREPSKEAFYRSLGI